MISSSASSLSKDTSPSPSSSPLPVSPTKPLVDDQAHHDEQQPIEEILTVSGLQSEIETYESDVSNLVDYFERNTTFPDQSTLPTDLVMDLSKIKDKSQVIYILKTLLQQCRDSKSILEPKLENSTSEKQRKVLSVDNYFEKIFENLMKTDSDDALNYLTPWKQANEVGVHVLQRFKTKFNRVPSFVYDATGGLGGNTFGFVHALKDSETKVKITTVELDTKRFECLKHNTIQYFRTMNISSKIECKPLEGNFLLLWKDIPDKEKTDSLVIFDPPWGNSDYSKHSLIFDLFMFDEAVEKSVNDLSREMIYTHNVSCVVLKVPFNYSEENLISHLIHPLSVEKLQIKKVKYLILTRQKI